jgi:D-sedoheptulose 7-phosphate isomerase
VARLARAGGDPRAGGGLTRAPGTEAPATVAELLERRTAANEQFFAREAARVAELCRLLAERFLAGGRLLACGASAQDRSDARHVAVEFVHPVIVGKRALPAICLAAGELGLLADADDAVIVFGPEQSLAAVRARGCLTIGFAPGAAEWVFEPPTDDPFVAQELVETLYHVLWELVHVFLEHAGRAGRDGGASSFLYPFLTATTSEPSALVDDVRASVLMKAREVGALRADTLTENGTVLEAAAADSRARLDAGATLFAFGNGGSATDAMDLVADLRAGPRDLVARRCLDLTDDPAILTALANDIGPGALYTRQLIAFGRPGDVAVAISTSGGSANIVEALAEARRRGLRTIAFVGYGGGRIAAQRLADHVIVVSSEHVPRIQEAQASAYHVLRELIG